MFIQVSFTSSEVDFKTSRATQIDVTEEQNTQFIIELNDYTQRFEITRPPGPQIHFVIFFFFSDFYCTELEVKIEFENRSRKQSHKLDGIQVGRIRTVSFSFDSAYDLVASSSALYNSLSFCPHYEETKAKNKKETAWALIFKKEFLLEATSRRPSR